MSGLSDYAENLLLDWMFRNTGTSPAAGTLYLAIHDSAPADTGIGGEQDDTADTNYTRVALTFGSAASGGNIATTAAITHTPSVAPGVPFVVSHVSIWDDTYTNGGNCLMTGTLAVSRTIDNASPLSFAIGDIIAALD